MIYLDSIMKKNGKLPNGKLSNGKYNDEDMFTDNTKIYGESGYKNPKYIDKYTRAYYQLRWMYDYNYKEEWE